jgi:hypothetical protein
MTSRNARETSAATPQVALPPAVTCDLCEAPMTLPAVCAAAEEIRGLLVCTQCIEDELDARAFNAGPNLELVGGRG